MKATILGIAGAALFASTANALQSCSVMYANHTQPFEQFGYWGKGELLGCKDMDFGTRMVHDRLGVRQAEYDTNMAYSDKNIDAYCTPGNGGEVYPGAFDRLFEKMFNDACTEVDCDTTVSVCEPVTLSDDGTVPDICATLQGEFINLEMRDNFANLIKTAHRAGIQESSMYPGEPAEIRTASGSSRIAVTTTKGDYSGYTMAVKFQLVLKDNSGCPAVVDTVTDALSNAPEIGAIFGIINVICNAIN